MNTVMRDTYHMVIGDLSWQIERNELFSSLYQRCIYKPGGIHAVIAILRAGGRDSALEITEKIDQQAIEVKNGEHVENFPLLLLLKNLTTLTNLSTGLSRDDYRNFIRYLIVTTDESLFGSPLSDNKTTSLSKEQTEIFHLFLEFPYLVTLTLMESILLEKVADPQKSK